MNTSNMLNKDFILECAKKIRDNKDIENTYISLISVMNDSNLIYEKMNLYKFLCNLTNNMDYLNLYINLAIKENHLDEAIHYFCNILYKTNPAFFEIFKTLLLKQGFEKINEFNISETEIDYDFILTCDRYHSLLYVIKYLAIKKQISEIFQIEQYLTDINYFQIQRFIYKHKVNRTTMHILKSVYNEDKYQEEISNIMSQIRNNMDLNKLAVRFCKGNKSAYLHIIKILIDNNKNQEALDFYNQDFVPVFHWELKKFEKISQLCWFMSDKYIKKKDFYSSVVMQQKAIENDL